MTELTGNQLRLLTEEEGFIKVTAKTCAIYTPDVDRPQEFVKASTVASLAQSGRLSCFYAAHGVKKFRLVPEKKPVRDKKREQDAPRVPLAQRPAPVVRSPEGMEIIDLEFGWSPYTR